MCICRPIQLLASRMYHKQLKFIVSKPEVSVSPFNCYLQKQHSQLSSSRLYPGHSTCPFTFSRHPIPNQTPITSFHATLAKFRSPFPLLCSLPIYLLVSHLNHIPGRQLVFFLKCISDLSFSCLKEWIPLLLPLLLSGLRSQTYKILHNLAPTYHFIGPQLAQMILQCRLEKTSLFQCRFSLMSEWKSWRGVLAGFLHPPSPDVFVQSPESVISCGGLATQSPRSIPPMCHFSSAFLCMMSLLMSPAPHMPLLLHLNLFHLQFIIHFL